MAGRRRFGAGRGATAGPGWLDNTAEPAMRHHAVTPSSERERLAAAFRAALYRILGPSGPIDLRIGRRSAALDRLLERAGVRCWAFLTASQT